MRVKKLKPLWMLLDRSEVFDCQVGMRQDENLSPFLFIFSEIAIQNYVSSKMQCITTRIQTCRQF